MTSANIAAPAFDQLMRARHSVRGFLPQEVPEPLLKRVFDTAQQAPSNCNVQAWGVHVASGPCAARLRTALHALAASGAASTYDIVPNSTYPGVYRDRQIASAKVLFAATGVARDDTAARNASMLRNYQFFDAPHAAFFFLPDWAGMREAADLGIYVQSLMLALTANGLASCAQGALGRYADVIHRELGVDSDLKLLFGMAFGYPDPAHPANAARTARRTVDESVMFHR